jgi:hypothetical protein
MHSCQSHDRNFKSEGPADETAVKPGRPARCSIQMCDRAKDAEEWEALTQSTVADDADPSFLAKLGHVTIRK